MPSVAGTEVHELALGSKTKRPTADVAISTALTGLYSLQCCLIADAEMAIM